MRDPQVRLRPVLRVPADVRRGGGIRSFTASDIAARAARRGA
jgi:hypothetical protein